MTIKGWAEYLSRVSEPLCVEISSLRSKLIRQQLYANARAFRTVSDLVHIKHIVPTTKKSPHNRNTTGRWGQVIVSLPGVWSRFSLAFYSKGQTNEQTTNKHTALKLSVGQMSTCITLVDSECRHCFQAGGVPRCMNPQVKLWEPSFSYRYETNNKQTDQSQSFAYIATKPGAHFPKGPSCFSSWTKSTARFLQICAASFGKDISMESEIRNSNSTQNIFFQTPATKSYFPNIACVQTTSLSPAQLLLHTWHFWQAQVALWEIFTHDYFPNNKQT